MQQTTLAEAKGFASDNKWLHEKIDNVLEIKIQDLVNLNKARSSIV